jgi:quercetin dioxygenase-like cupin family protein
VTAGFAIVTCEFNEDFGKWARSFSYSRFMTYSRRELNILLAAFGATDTPGDLSSHVWDFDDLPADKNKQTGNEIRQVFNGRSHAGCRVDLHITTLAPGQMPHAAHRHSHDEMIFMQEGTLEVTIEGKAKRIGPGGVAYAWSNNLHGWKNVGDGPARYFVLAIGKEPGVS